MTNLLSSPDTDDSDEDEDFICVLYCLSNNLLQAFILLTCKNHTLTDVNVRQPSMIDNDRNMYT